MKIPFLQKFIKILGYTLLGITLFGSILDAVNNSISLINFRSAFFITVFMVLILGITIVLLKKGLIPWRIKIIGNNDQVQYKIVKVSKMNMGIYIPMFGIFVFVWVAAFINQKNNIPKEVIKKEQSQFKQSKPRALREMFDSDFGGKIISYDLEKDVNYTPAKSNNTITLKINQRVHFDFDSRAKFVAFYVPSSLYTPEYCFHLISRVDTLLKFLEEHTNGNYFSLGEREMDVKDLKFTGRVFCLSSRCDDT
ncbi:MAG: hypothetical protein IPK91_16070 [Saprospiraceae bacterium]|nr:hypothetical protein [Saprospiraceae bacterium]